MDQTLEQLLKTLLGAGIDLGMPGGGGLADLIMLLIKRITPGIDKNDPVWDAMLTYSGSGYGAYMSRIRRMESEIGASMIGAPMESARLRYMENWQRTLLSESEFNKQREEARKAGKEDPFGGMEYDAFTQAKAQGLADNWMLSTLYKFTDPQGYNQLGAELGSAFSHIARPAFLRGERRAFSAANEIVGNMFRDENGNFNFRTEEYGNMSAEGVGRLTAELTRTSELLAGVDLGNMDELKSVSSRLQSKVKEFAQAMEPLKDMFGNDVPGMISTMEQISGQSIATMGVQRVRELSATLSSRFEQGNYDATELYVNTDATRRMMDQMGVSPYNKVFAHQQAMQMLDMRRGGMQPNWITKEDADKYATSRILKSANSPAADSMALAYSVWRQREAASSTPDNPRDLSMDAFLSEVDAESRRMESQGNRRKDSVGAAARLLGLRNLQELQQGRYYEGYRMALESQRMGGVIDAQNIENGRRRMVDYMAGSWQMRQAMEGYGWEGASKLTNREMAVHVDNMTRLVQANPELANMTMQERVETLRTMRDSGTPLTYVDAGGNERTIDLRTMFADDESITRVSAMMEGARYQFGEQMEALVELNRIGRVRQAERKSRERQGTIKDLGVSFSQTGMDLFNRLLEGGGKGFNIETMMSVLAQSDKMSMAGVTDEDRKTALGLKYAYDRYGEYHVAQKVAAKEADVRATSGEAGLAEWRRTQRSAFATAAMEEYNKQSSAAIRYGMTDVDALRSVDYQNALKELVDMSAEATEDGKPTDRQLSRVRSRVSELEAMRTAKHEATRRFISTQAESTTESLNVTDKQERRMREIRNALRKSGGDIDLTKLTLDAADRQMLSEAGYRFSEINESPEARNKRLGHNLRLAQREALGSAYRQGGTAAVSELQAKSAISARLAQMDEAQRKQVGDVIDNFWKSSTYKEEGLTGVAWQRYIEQNKNSMSGVQREQATALMNSELRGIGASGGQAADTTGLLERIVALLTELLPDVKKTSENTVNRKGAADNPNSAQNVDPKSKQTSQFIQR